MEKPYKTPNDKKSVRAMLTWSHYQFKKRLKNKAFEFGKQVIEIQPDSHTFTAPVAWMQTEAYQDVLLGSKVVFDLFDIEFKQADEKIVFKKRNDST